MNEDFVTFELAKKLKEKGFKEKVIKYYGKHENMFDCHPPLDMNDCGYRCSAPTISQVLKWLRKEHHLHFEVVGAAYGYNLIISDTPDKGGTDRYYSHMNDDGPNDGGAWDKYEDCVLYGIEYVLDNLI